jgi:hypothetical protein
MRLRRRTTLAFLEAGVVGQFEGVDPLDRGGAYPVLAAIVGMTSTGVLRA